MPLPVPDRVAAPVAPTPDPDPSPTVASPWSRDRPGVLAGLAFGLVCFALGWLRYTGMWATALDLGLFDQGIWLLSRGRAPELTVIDDNLFGDHLSLVLAVFAPLYRIRATPVWLLIAQATALGLAVPQMRRLARELGTEARWATVATVASAPLLAASMYDFHPIVLTVPVIAWALVAGRRDDVRACTIAAVLVVLIRADAAVLLLGVAVVAERRAARRLVALAPIGMALGALVPTLLGSQQTFTRYWGHLGESPVDAALHPWRLVDAVLAPSFLETAVIWLLPVGFLALCRPRWAAAAGVAGLPLLLSQATATSMPWFHNAAALVPFVVGGALAALAAPAERRRSFQHPAVLVTGLVLALALSSPLSPRAPESLRLPDVLEARPHAGLDEALAQVGPDEAVSADGWILTRLARRERAYLFPCPVPAIGGETCAVDHGDPPPDVIITTVDHRHDLERAGWDVDPVPGGDLVVARPSR